MGQNLWKVQILYPGGHQVEKRIRSDSLKIGAHPNSSIVLHKSYPQCVLEAQLKNGKVELVTSCSELKKAAAGVGKNAVYEALDLRISIAEISEQERQLNIFNWNSSLDQKSLENKALWHLHNGHVLETVLIQSKPQVFHLQSGYDLKFDPLEPFQMLLTEHNGDLHTLNFEHTEEGFYKASYQSEDFYLTPLPNEGALAQMDQPLGKNVQDRKYKSFALGLFATWIVLVAWFNFSSIGAKEEILPEEIAKEVAKIQIQKEKIQAGKKASGGNGQKGGGGVDYVKESDPRGGSGLAQVDEVVVSDKALFGSLSALSALSALDSFASAGDGVVRAGPKIAKGNAGGVLGALASLSGKGTGTGGVGIGGVGTKGFGGGGGGGKGAGFGTAAGDGLGEGNDLRRVTFDNDGADIQGGLERSEVDAVVRENLSQIRFCYNRGLRSNPSLQGKVVTGFTIGGNGSVVQSRIKTSTLSESTVENCIRERITSWKFPQPRGGGQVVVSYPFLLKSN